MATSRRGRERGLTVGFMKGFPAGGALATGEARARPSADLEAAFMARAERVIGEIATRLTRGEMQDLLASGSDMRFAVGLLSGSSAVLETVGSGDPLAAARLRGAEARRALLESEGGWLAPEDVARLLHISRQAVEKRAQRGRLFALPLGARTVFPAFQFDAEGVINGVEEVLGAFDVADPWMRAQFMLTGDPRLGGERPIEALRRGEIGAVVAAARAYGSHGAG
jgi:hypothetical protein